MEKNTLSKKNIIILRLSLIVTIGILGGILTYFNPDNQYSLKNILFDFIPLALGSSFFLAIIPLIIGLIRKIKKKKPTFGIYISYFFIIFTLSVLSYIGISSDSSKQEQSSQYNRTNTESNDNLFSFHLLYLI